MRVTCERCACAAVVMADDMADDMAEMAAAPPGVLISYRPEEDNLLQMKRDTGQ